MYRVKYSTTGTQVLLDVHRMWRTAHRGTRSVARRAATGHAARRERRGREDQRKRERRHRQLHVTEEDIRRGSLQSSVRSYMRHPRGSDARPGMRRRTQGQNSKQASEMELHIEASGWSRSRPEIHSTHKQLDQNAPLTEYNTVQQTNLIYLHNLAALCALLAGFDIATVRNSGHDRSNYTDQNEDNRRNPIWVQSSHLFYKH